MGPYYFRFYVYVTTFPNATNTKTSIFQVYSSANFNQVTIKINNNQTLTLHDDNSGLDVGSSSAINANQWYRVEVSYDASQAAGSRQVKAYLEGTQFASKTTGSFTSVSSIRVGGNLGSESNTASAHFMDDIAINDSTGASQTGLPGAGQIIHLQPNAQGDNNAFTVAVGGTAGAANNYTRVSEVTPDDATSYNGDAVSGHIDDHKMTATPSSIASGDTINVVAVGVRYRAVIAASEAAFKVRIKKASGGTVSSSAAITPNSTSWNTNANAAPNNYPLVTYQNPDAAAWTKALLDTAQVGYTISTTNTNAADISTVWVSIDSTPVVSSGGNAGIGRWLDRGFTGPENFFILLFLLTILWK